MVIISNSLSGEAISMKTPKNFTARCRYAMPKPTLAPSIPSLRPRSLIRLPSINPLSPLFCNPTTALRDPFHTSLSPPAKLRELRLCSLSLILFAVAALAGMLSSSVDSSVSVVWPGLIVLRVPLPFAMSVSIRKPEAPRVTPFIKPSMPARLAVRTGKVPSLCAAWAEANLTPSPPPAAIAAALKIAAALRPSSDSCKRWMTASKSPSTLYGLASCSKEQYNWGVASGDDGIGRVEVYRKCSSACKVIAV